MSDRPATEPRTEAGNRLIALLAEYQATADSDYPDKERRTAATEAYRDARETVKGLLPLIEAEAAQEAAPRAEGHHNRDGCNPYDEAHIAGKAGAEPPRCPCPDHVGPENAHPLSESAAPHHCDCTWRDNPNIWASPPACDGSCYNDPANCLHTEGAAPRAEGPPEGHVIGDRFVSDESFDAAIPAPRAEGLPSVEALTAALAYADRTDDDPSRWYSGEVGYMDYEDHARAVLVGLSVYKDRQDEDNPRDTAA